ncbi:MAG: hypothetical protein L3K17_00995 [Thermoplasmata archaeon]|nr:hypothetical protein [Thermoplasmata archaeon]
MPARRASARRPRRRAPTGRPKAAVAPPAAPVLRIVVPSAIGSPRLASLPEPPHTHLVCRSCARILELPMEFDDQQTLENLLLRAPAGWVVDSITVSLTGACARCRQGPSA